MDVAARLAGVRSELRGASTLNGIVVALALLREEVSGSHD